MKNFNTFCVACALLFICTATVAQVKVGDNGNTIRSASLLEMESTNKGFVFPRVSLSGTVTSPSPLAADILTGTVIYNTNAAFTGGIGLMVWTGSAWMAVSPSSLSSTDAWKLTGNSGTDSTINFLGTTDAQPLVFKVNGQKAGWIDYDVNAANTLYGYQAMNANTTGFNNVGIGYQALQENTTGGDNIAIGYWALKANRSGDENVAIGNGALATTTYGAYNVGIGANALRRTTVGSHNLATGSYSLFNNTSGSFNVANGSRAMYKNTSGNDNVATGFYSLSDNTSGSNNVASGSRAMYNNGTGNDNVATGFQSLYSNTDGNTNVANGMDALYSNTGGDSGVAVGYHALYSNSTGNNNTAIGKNSLDANTTGFNNTAVGTNSLDANTTGGLNTAVGYNADVATANLTNATAIGANAKVNVSNAIVLGNGASVGIGVSSPTKAKLQIEGGLTNAINKNYRYMALEGEGNSPATEDHLYSLYTSNRIWCNEEINVTSDERTKINIAAAAPGNDLSLINKLRVVRYNYKDRVAKGSANITGFLAQEVEQVLPDAVSKNKGVVPDIYQNAVTVRYNSAAKTLTLTLKENTAVQAGDTLKLITDAGEQLAPVTSVSGNTFTVGNWQQNSAWVFVYGRQVNDMLNLDYNKIFSTGIGAIQQLSKQNDDLKKDVETLQLQVKTLMDRFGSVVQSK